MFFVWPYLALPVARDVSGSQASTGWWGSYPKVVLPGSLCPSALLPASITCNDDDDPDVDFYSRATASAHTKLCLPFTRLKVLVQLRIGCAHLEVEQGRKRRPKEPRHERLCKLCSGEDATLARRLAVFSRTGTSRNVEDLKHFLLECPVYDSLRATCPAFPPDVYSTLSHPGCVALVMGHDDQAALAHTLYHMKTRRAELLGLPESVI